MGCRKEKETVEKEWEYDKSIHITFIHLRKDLESVLRRRLWQALEREYGVGGGLRRVVESMHEICSYKMRKGYRNEE